MTKEYMIETSKLLSVERLLECYGMHAVMLADRDYDEEMKARAKMANEVITAELLSRVSK